MRQQGMFDPARLVFIDETWTSTSMVRLRGRCPRGEEAAERTIPRLLRRIGRVVNSFSPQECRNFFRHAGYVRT
jgi:hypothetical protein